MEATNWQHAVAQALDQNNHQRAKQLLATVIRQHPQEREAWRILATIVTDAAQKAECLRRIAAIDDAAPITPLASNPRAEPMPSPERRILSIAKKTIPLADAQSTTQLASSAEQAMQANSKKTIPLADAQPTTQLAASDIKTTPLYASQSTTELGPNTANADLPTLRLSQPTAATPKQPRSLPKTLILLGASLCGIGLLLLLGLQIWPLLQTSDKTAAIAEPQQVDIALNIVRSGVGQTPMTDQAMVYFEIENPSDQALYNIPYTMTLTSQTNKVLKNTNTIELLLPKQKIVVTDGVFTGMKFRAKSIEISLGKGYPIVFDQAIPKPKLEVVTTNGINYLPDNLEARGDTYIVYNVVATPSTEIITSTFVSMLLYDKNDTIIGAGSDFIDIIGESDLETNRNNKTLVYTSIWKDTEVARVEIVPAFSLATFNQQPPIKAAKPEFDQMWLGEYIPAVDPPYHVSESVDYQSLPPTSGYHAAYPADWGYHFYDVQDEALVHNLEHGGVIIFYNPQLITPSELIQLEATFNTLYQRNDHTIFRLRMNLDATVAMTAWEYRLMLRDNANLDAVNTFFSEHIARGPECVNLRCPN
ncbi:DUF3105 domain-containing protein [Herpetosiphon llansteffanensis]|uniref:DUF3105 domain-containing protein n=1 Tax=Herpetosiphon llansteffanensis TaxID=2094568 RepID=UPI000D7CF689|nr:DUF3105 domain-containing protein [Herpetosiphon llansteffanensis]